MVKYNRGKVLTAIAVLILTVVLSTFMLVACDSDTNIGGAEVGNYYFDGKQGEYSLKLNKDLSAEMKIGDKEFSGGYRLADCAMALKFQNEMSATYKDKSIKLTYDNEEIVFIENIDFTVSFATNLNGEIESQTIKNGRLATKPVSDPTFDSGQFLGWFTDNKLTYIFDFASKKITADTKIYAKFLNTVYVIIDRENVVFESEVKPIAPEYNQKFTLTVPAMKTPVEGYVFTGYYSEADGKGEEITNDKGESLKKWTEDSELTVYAYFLPKLTFTKLENNTYAVSGNADTKDIKNLKIPSQYKGVDITKIIDLNGQNVIKLYIPSTIEEIEVVGLRSLAELTEIIVDENNVKFESIKGVLYGGENNSKLIKYPIMKVDVEYSVANYVIHIEDYAFEDIATDEGDASIAGKGVLGKVTFPSGICYIGTSAFKNRTAIINLAFADATSSSTELTIMDQAFYEVSVSSLELPASTRVIGKESFFTNKDHATDISGTSDLVLPDGLMEIGEGAFYSNLWIKKLTIPNTVSTIGNKAFYGCGEIYGKFTGGISEIVFQNNSTLESIGNYAFYEVDTLVSTASYSALNLPNSLNSIGEYAFYNIGMSTVNVGEQVQAIGNFAFAYNPCLVSITLPNTLKQAGNGIIAQCEALPFNDITIGAENEVFVKNDDAIFTADMKTLVLYSNTSVNTAYQVPNTVEAIADFAFYKNKFLTSIILNSELKSIGVSALSYTVLSSIDIPEGVTTISKNAFRSSTNIASVTIPSTLQSIGSYAFNRCGKKGMTLNFNADTQGNTALRVIEEYAFWSANITNDVVIPNGIEIVARQAFNGNSFSRIVFPNSLTTLGYKAFMNCHQLESVTLSESLQYVDGNPFWKNHIKFEQNATTGKYVYEEGKNLQIILPESNQYMKIVDGSLYSKDGKTLYSYIPNITLDVNKEYDTLPLLDITIGAEIEEIVQFAIEISDYDMVLTIDSQSIVNVIDYSSFSTSGIGNAKPSFIYINKSLDISANDYFGKVVTADIQDKEGYTKYALKKVN